MKGTGNKHHDYHEDSLVDMCMLVRKLDGNLRDFTELLLQASLRHEIASIPNWRHFADMSAKQYARFGIQMK